MDRIEPEAGLINRPFVSVRALAGSVPNKGSAFE
jgi:hypothetical protein